MAERRFPRVPARERCWCEGEDITIYAQIANISEGGLFLKTHDPLAPGARVRVRFPGDPPLELAAAVVWRRVAAPESREVPGMGLAFQGLDGGAAEALRGHLGRLLAEAT